MKNEEFYQLWLTKSEKFNYALLTLTFAILALSFQFSPKMGKLWPWVLIVGWICFVVSALFGGLRLSNEIIHLRLNYISNQLEAFIQERTRNLQDPQFLATVAAGNVLDNMTGKPLTMKGIQDNLLQENKALRTTNRNMEDAGKWAPLYFRIQFWLLLAGLVLNGVFVTKNFLTG